MGIQNARPIKYESPTYSPAMMALLDAQCHVKREILRDSYHREELTRETVSRLKAELKAARAKLSGEHRRTMRHSKRSVQLDQDYVIRHNIDVDLYEAYVPGDEFNAEALLPTADVVVLHQHRAAIDAAVVAAQKAALNAQNDPVAVAKRALAAAQATAAAAVAPAVAPVTPAPVRTTPPQKTFSEDQQYDTLLAELQSLMAA